MRLKGILGLGAAVLVTLVLAVPAASTTPVEGSGDYWFVTVDDEGCIELGVDGTLTGTLTVCQRGQNGTDKASFVGILDLDGETGYGTAEVSFSQTDRFTIRRGTGGLTGLHGQGIATDNPDGLSGSYVGQFHVDP